MRIACERLANGARLEWSASTRGQAGDALHVVVGGGRGCALHGCAMPAGIWLPLRGRVQLLSSDSGWGVETGEMLISEPEQRLQATGRGNALWLAILGTRSIWRRLLGGMIDVPTPDPLLLPARHAASRDIRRAAVRLARAALDPRADGERAAALDTLASSVLELQAALDALIGRCPGRTLAQRRHVFLRLQRVRNYMAANCHLDLDTDELARMASYSPWHFIRAFHAVYGETPHALLVKQRLERARRLVRTSELAIAEIALASGFENRCAFSRLFKQRFGITAADLRRRRHEPAGVAA